MISTYSNARTLDQSFVKAVELKRRATINWEVMDVLVLIYKGEFRMALVDSCLFLLCSCWS